MKKIITVCMVLLMTLAMSQAACAAGWQYDGIGWWWQNEDGTWPANEWRWLDGNNDGIAESYCFDASGYMYANCVTPDGYTVNSEGQWYEGLYVMTKTVSIMEAGVDNQPYCHNLMGTYGRYVTIYVEDIIDRGDYYSGTAEIYPFSDEDIPPLIARETVRFRKNAICHMHLDDGTVQAETVSERGLSDQRMFDVIQDAEGYITEFTDNTAG